MQHIFNTKAFVLLSALLLAAFGLQAQEVSSSNAQPSAEQAPAYTPTRITHDPLYEAMWDVQFEYAVSDSVGVTGGLAGAVYYNGSFWVSAWQTDTLYEFNMNGSPIDTFRIVNGGGFIAGTRAMTVAGNYIYVANNSSTIFKVNPATKTVVRTFTTAALAPQPGVRWITYDPTANSNAGGFWVGNFSTQINQIDTLGNVLQTIPATTHNIGGMYGAAYDGISAGGPYLWVHDQSGFGSTIRQISLASGSLGAVTSTTHDVSSDFGSGSGLAGGMFVASGIVTGQNTLGGLLQDGPNVLFGYELDFNPIAVDAGIESFSTQPAFGQIPERFLVPVGIGGAAGNFGSQALNSLTVEIAVDSNGTNVLNDNSNVYSNVAPFASNNFASSFTPQGKGAYTITATTNTGAQMDQNPGNDQASLRFVVGDSIYAIDDGVATGSYGVGSGGVAAWITLLYNMPANGYIKGVEIQLRNPRANDTTYAVLVQTTGGVPTGAPVAAGPRVLMNGVDTIYYLPLPVNFPVNAGSTWAVGVYQSAWPTGTIGLATSTTNFTPGINYFSTTGNSWTASGIANVRFIRAVMASCSIFDVTTSSTPDDGTGSGSVTAAAVNSSGAVTYEWKDAQGNVVGTSATLSGLAAGTYTVTVSDMNGCVTFKDVTVDSNVGIDDLHAGLNSLELYPNPTKGEVSFKVAFTQPESFEVSLHTLQGQVIASRNFEASVAQEGSFDLSEQAAGVYMLRVKTENGSTFRKVVLTK